MLLGTTTVKDKWAAQAIAGAALDELLGNLCIHFGGTIFEGVCSRGAAPSPGQGKLGLPLAI